ncbi:MAG: hypothetical protein J6I80_02560 [Clostridia bacterium]|nr:hypothetical protein [Clostridia bacterium]
MREIIYKYNNQGIYHTEQDTTFGNDEQLKLVIEPHEFSIAIGNEELRKTSFDGGELIVSCEGEVIFYDANGNVAAKAKKGKERYAAVRLLWKQDLLTVEFGSTQTVDHYPHCDGEHDRWSSKWIAEHTVKIQL